MGSFWGHMDEAIFFTILAVWWTFQACHQIIESQQSGKEITPRLSYTIRCGRNVPVETIFKILFPFGGFLAEVIDGGYSFIDEEGNFQNLVNAQHMTIYGIFILHSVLDLLTYAGIPVIPGAGHISAALSFIWYGVAFYYHSQMHGKEPLESVVHVLPIAIMFINAAAFLLEWRWQDGAWTLLTRAYGLLTLGTWFGHVAFILYEHDPFPGRGSSGLDRSDIHNVQYARASFGLHLLMNMLFILICYIITYFVKRVQHPRMCTSLIEEDN